VSLHELERPRSGVSAHEREVRTCLEGMVLGLSLRTGATRADVARELSRMCLEMADFEESTRK
jgi:hypothetical protein